MLKHIYILKQIDLTTQRDYLSLRYMILEYIKYIKI